MFSFDPYELFLCILWRKILIIRSDSLIGMMLVSEYWILKGKINTPDFYAILVPKAAKFLLSLIDPIKSLFDVFAHQIFNIQSSIPACPGWAFVHSGPQYS